MSAKNIHTGDIIKFILVDLIFTYHLFSVWLVIAGVQTDKETYPDFQQIFRGFFIPDMKLPLRLVKLMVVCNFNDNLFMFQK